MNGNVESFEDLLHGLGCLLCVVSHKFCTQRIQNRKSMLA